LQKATNRILIKTSVIELAGVAGLKEHWYRAGYEGGDSQDS
jgi:hypothetical protein